MTMTDQNPLDLIADLDDDQSAILASTFSRILAETAPAASALDAGLRERMGVVVDAIETSAQVR